MGIVDILSDNGMLYFNLRKVTKTKSFLNINQLEFSFMRPTPFKVVYCCILLLFVALPVVK